MQWWKNTISSSCQPIRPDSYDKVICTDASLTGFGAHCNNNTLCGHWTLDENFHINILELLAVERALHYFCRDDENIKILLRIDNQTAVAYINKLGGTHSQSLHIIAKRIWSWAMGKNIWLTASYIKSQDNYIADEQSRLAIRNFHWQLNPSLFKRIIETFGVPTIDLFASECNCQVPRFVSFKPERYALFTDAFTIPWSNELSYIFPPFALI